LDRAESRYNQPEQVGVFDSALLIAAYTFKSLLDGAGIMFYIELFPQAYGLLDSGSIASDGGITPTIE